MLENTWNLLRLGLGAFSRPTAWVLNTAELETSANVALELARAKDFKRLAKAKFIVPADQNEARAFWINLYNTLTLHAMQQARIEATVLESLGFYARFAYLVNGLVFSLNDIEHGVLRENRAGLGRTAFAKTDSRTGYILPLEPRIHFALNCGAVSCPPIRVYSGADLENQLELATASYLQDCRLEANVVWLPRLLSFYPSDFGQPLEFVRRYRPDLPALARVRYLPYSWKKF